MQPALVPGIALSAIGVYLGSSFGRDLYFGWASRRWRKAHGHVVSEDTYAGVSSRYGNTLNTSAAVLTYTYTVNGVEYTSNRYDYAGRNVGAGASDVLNTFSVGNRVAVWYDPFEPRRAVLVQGV